ncbi:MAG: AbrB/MazE/SpoVT family DNA-binding domain-containing protein [Eggerthellaceae bacterium]|nr:AbrB/MazE/SpoVT family DNA-binding domain-containing protein [Eggerthellaceae bacterium]
MATAVFADTAKVMPKGQVTIPKDVRAVLGVSAGDKVTFLVEGATVRVVNAATYAMQVLQQQMAGEAERAGIAGPDDVDALVAAMRAEE